MTERLDQKITNLRKSGQIDEAYNLAKNALTDQPDNFYLRGAMSWVLYEKVKTGAESIKAAIEANSAVPSGRLRDIDHCLDEYLNLSLPVPDLSLSLILSRLVKPVGRYVPGFLKFLATVCSRADDIFRDEDNQPYEHAYGAAPSLQTKVAREAAARCLQAEAIDAVDADVVERLLERAKGNEFDTLQNKIWIAYDLSKLYAQTDRYEKAVEEAKQTVRQKREEWWAWHWLGKLYFGKSNEKAIACLCEAISCPHDEDKIGKLRLDLAALLKHSGDIAGAVTECLIVAETYEQRGWKFPDRLNQAMGADWFDSSLARDSNQEVYERFADDAVEITFSRIEEYPASFVRDIKTRETGKRLVVFATRSGDESVQQVLPSKVAGGMELRTGDPVFLRVAIDGDIEYTLHCKNRKGEAFDCCAQRMGVISNHSRDGRSAGVYLSEKAETVVSGLDAEAASGLPLGTGVQVWVSMNQKNQHLECFKYERLEQVPKLPGLEAYGGILRGTDREFGFVEDTFVPPGLMNPMLEGNLVQGVKIRSFDKSKNQYGWRAITLEPLNA